MVAGVRAEPVEQHGSHALWSLPVALYCTSFAATLWQPRRRCVPEWCGRECYERWSDRLRDSARRPSVRNDGDAQVQGVRLNHAIFVSEEVIVSRSGVQDEQKCPFKDSNVAVIMLTRHAESLVTTHR